MDAPLTAEAKEAKQLTVGVVIPYEVGWFGAFKQGFDLVANEEGVKAGWQYHNYKADQETAAAQNLITLGVDAINVTAATADSAQYSCPSPTKPASPSRSPSGISAGQGKPVANIDFNWEQIYRFAVEHIRGETNGPLSMVYLSALPVARPSPWHLRA